MRIILAAAAALALSVIPAAADPSVQVGRLSCTVEGGVGLIITSTKALNCTFTKKDGSHEHYSGKITKIGLDIGITKSTQIEWLVFTAAGKSYSSRAMAGNFVGASGEATFGAGLGANWLIGGSKNAFSLQPWSVQAQTGFNLSLAGTILTLN
ncbi:MAG: DUF992 domain-containing protein [Alphaproteobacteria bacterium]|nr:DUF992 domain-containing protein [Alphaproteobacteria bacterium]